MGATRSALVIGANEFADPKFQRLRSPSQDVAALADVLGDAAIGGFDVRSVVNQPNSTVQQELERFFSGRKPEDLLFLYFSCHGVKDPTGRLYFVTSNTTFDLLRSTGVSAAFVSEQMEYSRSRRIVVLLDCCYSGAFLKGFRARGDDVVAVEELEGRGRAVITASRATEYAFEADELAADKAQPSMFTGAVVEGLSTGGADANGDGFVTVDELYDYVYDAVRGKVAGQTPGRWIDVEGDLVVARNPHPPVRAAALPAELERAVASELALQRLGAVTELARWHRSGDAEQQLAAEPILQQLTHDYDERVKAAALQALSVTPEAPPVAAEPIPLTAPAEPAAAPAPAAEPEATAPPAAGPLVTATAAGEPEAPLRRADRIAAWLAAVGALAVLLSPYFDYLHYDGYSDTLSDREELYPLGAFIWSGVAAWAAVLVLRTHARSTGYAVLVGLLPVSIADVLYWPAATAEDTSVEGAGLGWALQLLGPLLVASGGVIAALRLRSAISLAPPRPADRRSWPATATTAAALLVGWLVTHGWAIMSGLKSGDGAWDALEAVRDLAFWLLVIGAAACGGGRWLQAKGVGSTRFLLVVAAGVAITVGLFLTSDDLQGGRHGVVDAAIAVLAIGAATVPPLATLIIPRRLGPALLAAWTVASAAWLPATLANDDPGEVLAVGLAAAAGLAYALHLLARRPAPPADVARV